MLQMGTVLSTVDVSQSALHGPVVSDHPLLFSNVNEFSSSLYAKRSNIILFARLNVAQRFHQELVLIKPEFILWRFKGDIRITK